LPCHNQKAISAATASGIVFDRLDSTKISEAPAAWEKVVRKRRTGSMPPEGSKRPDEATTHALIQTLETDLDRAAALHPNPRKPVLRHLNPIEYGSWTPLMYAARQGALDAV